MDSTLQGGTEHRTVLTDMKGGEKRNARGPAAQQDRGNRPLRGALGNRCVTTHSGHHSGTNTECHEGAEEEEVTEDWDDPSQGDGPSVGL